MDEIIQKGSTILKTARCEEFKTEEGRERAARVLDMFGIGGLAGGAESILIPEKDFDKNEIYKKIFQGKFKGKIHHLVLVAEGKSSRVLGIRHGGIIDVDINEAPSMPRMFNEKIYKMLRILSS